MSESGLFDTFETNVDKEVDGVWHDFSANKDGSLPGFQIASTGKANKAYAKALQKATKPYRALGRIDDMPEEIAEKVFLDVFVDHILKGWRNVKDKDGSDIPFNRDNAISLMKKLPRLYERLQNYSNAADAFKDEIREGEAGN